MRKNKRSIPRFHQILSIFVLVAAAGLFLSNRVAKAVVSYDCSLQSTMELAECDALIDLYNSTAGESWTLTTNWLDTNPCGWQGITCTGTHVRYIELNSNNLVGTIPTSIGNFPNLERLNLSNNTLTGSIPTEIGSLTSLQRLELNNNTLSGSIPTEIGGLTSLQWLQLQHNQLDGTLPASLGALSNLSRLFLNSNLFTGEIPSELGNLSNLQYLYLNSNSFSGPLPQSLINLDNLVFFSYHTTSICTPPNPSFQEWLIGTTNSGTGISCTAFCSTQSDIPQIECEALGELYFETDGDHWSNNTNWLDMNPCGWYGISCFEESVYMISLTSNSLTGSIPASLGNLSYLNELGLGHNSLTGEIPPELGSLSSMQWLKLENNALTGFIPEALSNAAELIWLGLDNNLLEGPLPLSFVNLTNVVYFHYNINDICEPNDVALQSWLDGISDLVGTGIDCAAVCSTQSSIDTAECLALEDLYYSTEGQDWYDHSDWFSADPCTWKGVLCFSNHVSKLYLNNNNLGGSLPASIGDLFSLDTIFASNNNIGGTIPAEIGLLTNLYQIQLASNQLTGSIPTEIGGLSGLLWLHLDGNNLSGPIPASMGGLTSMDQLFLNGNNLDGTIPTQLGNLTNLTWLDLKDNLLSGPLPLSLSNLTVLEDFHYENTSLCEPTNSAFVAWLTAIPSRTGTGVPCPISLFEADFETADLSQWSSFNDGGGFLYACAQAAINGSYGACVEKGSNNNRKQLIDQTPNGETVFNARFNFDVNSLSMGLGDPVRIMQFKMLAERPAFLVLQRFADGYKIQLNVKEDDLSKSKTAWILLSDAPHTIEIDWAAATSDGANDGYITLYVDDVEQDSLTGLDNDTFTITSFRMGFTSRLAGKAISGIFYIDDVVTNNTGYIGLP